MRQLTNKQAGIIIRNIFIVIFAILLLAYALIGKQLHNRPYEVNQGETSTVLGPVDEKTELEQLLHMPINQVVEVKVPVATFGRENQGELILTVKDAKSNQVLARKTMGVKTLSNLDETVVFDLSDQIYDVNYQELKLSFTSTSPMDQAVAIYGTTDSLQDTNGLLVNGEKQEGQLLNISVLGNQYTPFGRNYLIFSSIILLIVGVLSLQLLHNNKNEKNSIIGYIHGYLTKYNFLMAQLVSRDFKGKYKRSVLGIFWSFLNPLLTMLVQFIVFSQVFKSDIANFPVYLLTGVVFFNFFSEACSGGLGSIVYNNSLLTKVYIPSEIFPITKLLSSFINFALSLIPLFAVLLITGGGLSPLYVMMLYPIFCAVLFSFGMILLLSSLMVFFRDIQFIWSVVNMLWMYATPIFYPEDILNTSISTVIKLNPLYHFIRFTRTILLEHRSPSPQAYLLCFVAAVVPLMIGAFVYAKTKDKFIMHL